MWSWFSRRLKPIDLLSQPLHLPDFDEVMIIIGFLTGFVWKEKQAQLVKSSISSVEGMGLVQRLINGDDE